MIIVSNTSPLNYLILIRAIDILPGLSEHVIIPESVANELAHDRAPEPVRSWIASPPSWLEVRAPNAPDRTMMLDVGERDALSLALELKADLVLIDDKGARTVAKDRGLSVAGTLAVLELASQRGLVDLPVTLSPGGPHQRAPGSGSRVAKSEGMGQRTTALAEGARIVDGSCAHLRRTASG